MGLVCYMVDVWLISLTSKQTKFECRGMFTLILNFLCLVVAVPHSLSLVLFRKWMELALLNRWTSYFILLHLCEFFQYLLFYLFIWLMSLSSGTCLCITSTSIALGGRVMSSRCEVCFAKLTLVHWLNFEIYRLRTRTRVELSLLHSWTRCSLRILNSERIQTRTSDKDINLLWNADNPHLYIYCSILDDALLLWTLVLINNLYVNYPFFFEIDFVSSKKLGRSSCT